MINRYSGDLIMQKYQNMSASFDSSDAILARLAVAGDKEAFEALIQRYYVSLFNYIYRLMGDRDEASDLLQEVFLRFYTSLSTLRTDKPFKSWLFQVAHNCCIDALRQRRKYVIQFSQFETGNDDDEMSVLDSLPDSSPSVEFLAEQHDLQYQLQQAILTLPIKFRSVVLLRYTSNLRFSDIGCILGMPEQTAKTYFNRAKVLLRKALAREVYS
jgi:RNA polymerase sigma factor (sigma-70 family)